ncbi:SDR family NAD(P)-dependent oxidoreductase [Conexibacter woesei]|uniref:Short-chain dehydrogenase/reductase SDR n=1 Tax=Conexibacter woesei (strain DSM 14684 / CCUG 47730 / CIP 108061 / JCM 11494 / NBRC 100937 / ID131577) TaxID=469383 RepID=D3F6J6_CONWI|nr:glucose 1-dehydrogenase [Conexibacter woesei]ADB50763.1 short-chain dehydrogenase/reductase SDR [Conexibacter woesei DSM 14684]
MSLAGRVAIVTGASRGIGRGVAERLAAAGADLALAGRSAEALEQAARELRAVHGVRALAIPADVTSETSVEALVARTLEQLGGLHVLVNNSGIAVEGPFLDQSLDDFDRVLATNLRGVALCCRAAGRHLVAQGEGKVVTIASNLGLAATPGLAAYSASKGAVLALTRVLAIEWARHNVQVNAIAPGYVETEINAAARADERVYEGIVRRIPARRFGRPQEVGDLAVLLAGSGSDFITGETIVVDGGQLARA